MKETLEFLKACGTFFLATSEGSQPHVRPFGAVCEFEGKLYIITSNKKAVYNQMLDNPKVEITGINKGQWIRLQGEVELDTRREARVAMIDDNKAALSPMYNADDNLMVVFRFTHATATIYSFTDAPKTYNF